MKKLIVILCVTVTLMAGCAGTKHQEYLQAQVDMEKYKVDKVSLMIQNTTTVEQSMLMAFMLGQDRQVELQRLPEWHEAMLPWGQMFIPWILGGWHVGDKGNGSINVNGKNNTVMVHKLDNVKNSNYYPAYSQSKSYVLDYNRSASSFNQSTEYQGE